MYYKHSGRFSLGGVLLGLVVGCVSAVALGYAYGRGLGHIPEAHIAFFATIAFGILIGAATALGLMWGRIRNKGTILAVTAFSSLVALYVSWAVWIDAVFRRVGNNRYPWQILAQHPVAVWRLMKWTNHFGTWAFDNSDTATKGWALAVIWVSEAVAVIGCALAAGAGLVLQRPFCEACGCWCRRAVRLVLMPAPDPQQLKQQIENRDLRTLQSLGPAMKASDHLIMTLHSCHRCGQFHTLTLTQVLVVRRKFGQAPLRSSTFLRHLIVDPGQAQEIRQFSEKVLQAHRLAPVQARGAASGQR